MKETTYTGDGSGLMPQPPTEIVGEYTAYARSIGVNVRVEKSDNPDTFEKIFGDIKEVEGK